MVGVHYVTRLSVVFTVSVTTYDLCVDLRALLAFL